jgi:hypothetical protein
LIALLARADCGDDSWRANFLIPENISRIWSNGYRTYLVTPILAHNNTLPMFAAFLDDYTWEKTFD